MLTSREIKEKNINEIFQIIRKEKEISRVEIAKKMNMSQTSVGRLVSELIEASYIIEVGNIGGSIGRQRIRLQVVPESALALGVFLTPFCVETGLVDVTGKIIVKKKIQNFPLKKPTDIIEVIKKGVNSIVEELSEQNLLHLVGVGITLPGTVDYRTGMILKSSLLGVHNFPMGNLLEMQLPYRIVIDNAVSSCAKMQRFIGNVLDSDEFMVMNLGDEISMSQMINGKIARGKDYCFGELGHVIVSPNGELCECGRRGCLQTVIGKRSVENELSRSFSEAVKDFKTGDIQCEDVLKRLIAEISRWIANIIYIFDPGELILTGTMLDEWEEMFDLIATTSMRLLGNYLEHKVVIRRNELYGAENDIVTAASNIFYKFQIKEGRNDYDSTK